MERVRVSKIFKISSTTRSLMVSWIIGLKMRGASTAKIRSVELLAHIAETSTTRSVTVETFS